MCRFDPGQRRGRRMERFESERGSGDSLDKSVILLNHIVQVFALHDADEVPVTREFSDHIYGQQPCQIGIALIDSNAIRRAICYDRTLEETACGSLVSLC